MISTIHQSKGLEWDAVFVPHFNEGFLPSAYRDDDGRMPPPLPLPGLAKTSTRAGLHKTCFIVFVCVLHCITKYK